MEFTNLKRMLAIGLASFVFFSGCVRKGPTTTSEIASVPAAQLDAAEQNFRKLLLGLTVSQEAHAAGEQLAKMYEADNRPMEAAWTLRAIGEVQRSAFLVNQMEQTLRGGTITARRPLGGGITPSFVVEFDKRLLAVFKPLQQSGKSAWSSHPGYEEASYLIDKLIGLGLVPVTVQRNLNGEFGSLQVFIRDAGAGDKRSDLLRTLDYLIFNRDRNPGNFITRFGKQVVAVDHSVSFGVVGPQNPTFTPGEFRIPAPLKQRMRAVSLQEWAAVLKPILAHEYHSIMASAPEKRGDPRLAEVLKAGEDGALNLFLSRLNALLSN